MRDFIVPCVQTSRGKMSTQIPLSSTFLGQTTAAGACTPTQVATATCNFADIDLSNCPADITCTNTATGSTSYSCTQAQLDAVLDATLAANPLSPSEVKVANAITSTSDSSGATAVKQYINVRCNPSLISNNYVAFPKLYLTDCSNASIAAVNSIDQGTRCTMGALDEIVPRGAAQPAPPVAPNVLWYSLANPLVTHGLILGGLVLLLLAVLVGMVTAVRGAPGKMQQS